MSDYTLRPNLEEIVKLSKRAYAWDTNLDRLAAQRAVIAGHKSTEGPGQFGRVTITGQPAALSRPQSMVRDALRMGGCPHRALGQIADDDLAVARQLLADEMEGRHE